MNMFFSELRPIEKPKKKIENALIESPLIE
jgi:hypothetical protein